MIPFDRYRNTGEGRQLVRYFILTREEADKRGVTYVPWRQAKPERSRPGKVPLYGKDRVDKAEGIQHVIDDNGYVSAIYDGVSMVNKRTGQIQVMFVFSRRYASRKPFGYGNKKMTSNFSWDEKESRRERTRRVVVAYTRILLDRTRLTEKDWLRLGTLWRDDQEKPISSIKRIFRTKAVKQMVRDELARLMTSAGVSPEEVIKSYEDLRIEAKEDKNFVIQKAILDKYTDILDMKPDKLEVTQGLIETRDMTYLLNPEDAIPETPGLLEQGEINDK